MHIEHRDAQLCVTFEAPQSMLSWALHNGGARRAQRVVWLQVRNGDLPIHVDPVQLLVRALGASDRLDAVGLMTSGALSRHVVTRAEANGVAAACVATVGLSNALRVGDPQGTTLPPAINTINLLAWTSTALSPAATLEALSIATEARTLAVHDANVASIVTAERATGTGTDCIVIASPADAEPGAPYAGKHTTVGHLIGKVVVAAVREGVSRWKAAR